MSLEPITKKDIENLFNKILRSQINRQKNGMCTSIGYRKQKTNNTKRRKQYAEYKL